MDVEKREIVYLDKLQNIDALRFREMHGMKSVDIKHIYLEKAQAFPEQGVVSTFNYGTGYGLIRGWIEMLAIPHTLVAPLTWTTIMHKGAREKLPKKKSWEIAKRIFPNQDFKATPRCRVPHMGLVDAALIAEYGRRIYR